MLHVLACAICGGDPATDSMIVSAAVAGAMSMPWIFRDKVLTIMRRMTGRAHPDSESCPIAPDEGD